MGRSKLSVVVFSLFLFPYIPCAFSQQASVTPSTLNFAPQVVNPVSPGSQPQTITLTNTGNSDLIVSSVLASGGYKQTNTCSTLSPHESCTVEVNFTPATIETINGAITINDNAPSSPQVVSLSGKGIAHARLSPRVVRFGTVAVGTTSQPQAVKLTAAPSSSFSVNQISISGDYAQTNNCPATLQNGQSCTIQVVFHPTVNAPVRGALAVSTAAGNVPLPEGVLPALPRFSERSHIQTWPSLVPTALPGLCPATSETALLSPGSRIPEKTGTAENHGAGRPRKTASVLRGYRLVECVPRNAASPRAARAYYGHEF